jgi:hypothetical protein
MSGGGGGGGSTWVYVLILGFALCGAGYGLEHLEIGPAWLHYGLLAIGGIAVIFGSCESMIHAVDGIGARLGWNQFIAGTFAGLASNIPEIVMLAFVVAAAPRIAFIVVALTLHVNSLMFGVYSGLLPRDQTGLARMPDALVKNSTDLFAAGGGVFLATGSLMVVMREFRSGEHGGLGFGIWDLYAMGIALLLVQVIAVVALVRQFTGPNAEKVEEKKAEPAEAPPSWLKIGGYSALGLGASIVGGHAVGDFADALVRSLEEAGYPEMVGALILSVFAGTGAYVMIATSHVKKMYDIALANVSGAITQVPFVVLPCVMLLMAVFAQTGVIPMGPQETVLAIDLESTSVILLAFPPMLILWKSVQDDGKLNWTETAGMLAVFGLTIYFLARHG